MATPLVTIVGCGALGSLFGARLLSQGVSVQILQRPGTRFETLAEEGIVISKDQDGARHTYAVTKLSSTAESLHPADLVVVLVKSYATAYVTQLRQLLKGNGAVLTLQNGLGNVETLVSQVGAESVFAGTTSYGAFVDAAGEVNWGGEGEILLGPWQQLGIGPISAQRPSARFIGSLLERGGLNVSLVEDPRPALWRKLAVNLVTNPLTAIIGCRNGELLDSPSLLPLMRELLGEFLTVVARSGINIDMGFDELWQQQLQVLEGTARNRSSMLQDVLAGRATEINSITGALLAYAEQDDEFPIMRTLQALVSSRSLVRS